MYKYSRERLAKLFFDYEDKCDFLEDLLAQKEDRKEWQKEILLGKDVGSPDGDCKIYGYWDNKTMVITRIEHTTPTPSPLEIEEIEKMSNYADTCEYIRTINSLISNQKKLYQYIKEKI